MNLKFCYYVNKIFGFSYFLQRKSGNKSSICPGRFYVIIIKMYIGRSIKSYICLLLYLYIIVEGEKSVYHLINCVTKREITKSGMLYRTSGKIKLWRSKIIKCIHRPKVT